MAKARKPRHSFKKPKYPGYPMPVTEEDFEMYNWMILFVHKHNKKIANQRRKERRLAAPGFPEDN